MTSDVYEGSPRELGNLFECVSLEEEESDGLLLLRGEPGVQPRRQLLSQNAFHRQFVKRKLTPGVGQKPACLLQVLAGIEVTGIEVAPTVEGPVIGHLENPRARCTLGRVEQGGFAENEEKNLLHQIVRLRFVLQYPAGDVAHGAGMAAKENT